MLCLYFRKIKLKKIDPDPNFFILSVYCRWVSRWRCRAGWRTRSGPYSGPGTFQIKIFYDKFLAVYNFSLLPYKSIQGQQCKWKWREISKDKRTLIQNHQMMQRMTLPIIFLFKNDDVSLLG